jgi:hypothetical protein
VTWPFGTPLPSENEREADRVTEITVQKEETVGGTERVIKPDEGAIATDEIH